MSSDINLAKDLNLVLPLILLFLASIVPMTLKVVFGNKEPRPMASLVWSMIGLLAASGTTFVLIGSMLNASDNSFIFGFSNLIVADGISLWTSYLIYLLGAIGLLLSYDHVATRGSNYSTFIFLYLTSIIGMVLLSFSNDLIFTFIALELTSLTLYLLIAISHERVLPKEAAFKYFILGSFASAFFLFGVSFLYGTTGSTSLVDITGSAFNLFTTSKIFVIGFVIAALGFAFKVSLFPLHSWTPDVYQGASTPVTTLMSTAVKAAAYVAFLRLFLGAEFFKLSDPVFFNVIQWLAVLTMLVGNVGALMQDNLKRMLAYSSVAHSGYIMVGLISAGFGTNERMGATGLLFYVFAYSLMTVGTFAMVAVFEKKLGQEVQVSDLKGLASRHPLLAFSFFVLLISLAGIPPTLGFFGKLFIFSTAVQQGFIWLVVWGVINSVVSVYYYFKPIVFMYMKDDSGLEPASASHHFTKATVVASMVFVLVLGVASGPLLKAIQKAVMGL
jgi:NADH-quinone oxidoreductase subunit N